MGNMSAGRPLTRQMAIGSRRKRAVPWIYQPKSNNGSGSWACGLSTSVNGLCLEAALGGKKSIAQPRRWICGTRPVESRFDVRKAAFGSGIGNWPGGGFARNWKGSSSNAEPPLDRRPKRSVGGDAGNQRRKSGARWPTSVIAARSKRGGVEFRRSNWWVGAPNAASGNITAARYGRASVDPRSEETPGWSRIRGRCAPGVGWRRNYRIG